MNIDLDQLPPVLTADHLMAIYGHSRETIRRKTDEGYFPRIKGFHKLLYLRTDILKLLGAQAPADPEDDGDGRPPNAP